MKSANEWEDMRKEINELHRELSEKPGWEMRGYQVSPGGILNAYREGDVSFDDAVKKIESLILADRAEMRRAVVKKIKNKIRKLGYMRKETWTIPILDLEDILDAIAEGGEK